MGSKFTKVKAATHHESTDQCHDALMQIREAQQKYFNSHIENEHDSFDGDGDDDDLEDSVDGMYDSQSSLDLLENDSVDNVATEETSSVQAAGEENGAESSPSKGETQNGGVQSSAGGSSGANGDVQNNTTGSSNPKKNSKGVKRREKAKYIRLSKRGNFFSIYNTEDKKARSVNPCHYEYPFENLVFEGGGNKGLAYCGCVRLLEEIGVWPQIRRVAGTSAGAMTAALLAVGYNSHDLEEFFSLNLNDIFLDHRFGYLSLLPNLLKSYGWNPGNRIYRWFGDKLKDKTNNADITFRQLYESTSRELCIVVTNLNQMTSLYCHPKTTPEMPVRLAVRMSMSIPGLFQAVSHTLHGQTDVFVDGGVLCNYPIHCFDGWWLSMEPSDNYLEKLQPLEDIPRLLERTERFGTYNDKTLGFQLYADNEQDLLKYQLENLRHGVQLQELPNTKLAREKIKKKKLQLKTDREHRRLVKAMNSFLKSLRRHNLDMNNTIDREELEAALEDETFFPQKMRLILFGDVSSDIILQYLDRDQNGQGDAATGSTGGNGISYNELVHFMEETGISMQNRFLGYQRRHITSFPKFLDTLQATLLTNVKRVYVEERDLKRTVGINTGHVGTSDFVLERADVEFVLERGRRSLEAFLKYYVANKHLKKKPEFRKVDPYGRKGSKASLLTVDSADSELNPSTIASNPAELSDNNDKTEKNISYSDRTSSGKSVHISNKIEILEKSTDSYEMRDTVCHSIDEYSISEDGPNVCMGGLNQDSESSALLQDAHDKQSQSKRPFSLPNTMSQAISKVGKQSPHNPPTSASLVEGAGVATDVKYDGVNGTAEVVIHKSPEHPESPKTPLLESMGDVE